MPAIDDNGQVYVPPPNTPAAKTVTAVGAGLQGSRSTATDPSKPGSYINLPADSRLDRILKYTNSPLSKGIISQLDIPQSVDSSGKATKTDQKYPFACRFLFNPTTISVSYAVDESQIPPGDLSPAQAAGIALVPGTTTISFSLLFDRTFEVAYGSKDGLRDIRDIGCYEDVGALEAVVQAAQLFRTDPVSYVDPTSGNVTASTTTLVKPNQAALPSNMAFTTVACIFGGGDGSDSTKPVPGLAYIGAITSMGVTYTHFSSRMVPMRCEVDITMTQLLGRQLSDYKANPVLHTVKSTPTAHTTAGRGR